MGHNGLGINLYGDIMGNVHAGGQSNLGHLSLLRRADTMCLPWIQIIARRIIASR